MRKVCGIGRAKGTLPLPVTDHRERAVHHPGAGLEELAALARTSSSRLFRVAMRLLANRAEAEDAVQEGCLRAYDAIQAGQYDDRGRMETWLYTIVTRVAMDMLRSRKAREPVHAQIDPASVAWPGATEEQILAILELDRWLAVLPPDQRAAVVLKELEGMTHAEVGLALGVSEGAIEQRLLRARATLKRRMSDEGR